jgi:hypothetical protein
VRINVNQRIGYAFTAPDLRLSFHLLKSRKFITSNTSEAIKKRTWKNAIMAEGIAE